MLDLITCGATHGYLPLLRESPEAVRAQLLTAVREHQRLLGQRPLGIWLPECAYYEDLDRVLAQCGLRYSLLDGHGLLHALPRPRFGVYAPICSPAGVAFFGRDSESTLPVWSASQGYPGDGAYREFHRDLGWDLPAASLLARGIRDRRPLGLKLHRVTAQGCPLEQKQPYDPERAAEKLKEHAESFLRGRSVQMQRLAATIEQPPLLVAPFDAELFGHWWFEGPRFLAELFRRGPDLEVSFSHLREVLSQDRALQVCRPSPSSWGQGGYHDYWLNDTNAWVVAEWQRASRAMVRRVNRGVGQRRAAPPADPGGPRTAAGPELRLEFHPAGRHHHRTGPGADQPPPRPLLAADGCDRERHGAAAGMACGGAARGRSLPGPECGRLGQPSHPRPLNRRPAARPRPRRGDLRRQSRRRLQRI